MELKDLISDRRPDTLNRGQVRAILDADGDYRNKGWGGQPPPPQPPPQTTPPQTTTQTTTPKPGPKPAPRPQARPQVKPKPAAAGSPSGSAAPAAPRRNGPPIVARPRLKSARAALAEAAQRAQLPRPDFVVNLTLKDVAKGKRRRIWLPNGPFRIKSAILTVRPGAPDGQRQTLWRRGVKYTAEARIIMPPNMRREGSCLYQYWGYPFAYLSVNYRSPLGKYSRFAPRTSDFACYRLEGQGLPVYDQPRRTGDAYIWLGNHNPWELPPMPTLPRARYGHTLPAAWLRSAREGVFHAVSGACRRIFRR